MPPFIPLPSPGDGLWLGSPVRIVLCRSTCRGPGGVRDPSTLRESLLYCGVETRKGLIIDGRKVLGPSLWIQEHGEGSSPCPFGRGEGAVLVPTPCPGTTETYFSGPKMTHDPKLAQKTTPV